MATSNNLAVRVVEGRTILDYVLGQSRLPKSWLVSGGEVAVVFVPPSADFSKPCTLRFTTEGARLSTGTRPVGPRARIRVVLEMLVTLTRCDLEEEDYDLYDGSNRPSGPLDPNIAGRGLGEAGSVHALFDIWKKHAPTSLKWALDELPDQAETRDPGLAALAHRMCEDDIIHRDYPHRDVLADEAKGLASDLVSAGWKGSPKSDIEPKTSITWLGKTISSSDLSLAQAPTTPGAAAQRVA